MSKVCAVILQSNYIPWRGYFSLISNADIFVILDSAQYTKNDWRNRNRLRNANGVFWLTIPVRKTGLELTIYEAQVSNHQWTHKHFISIKESLSKLPGSNDLTSQLESLFKDLAQENSLHTINTQLIRKICEMTSIKTPIRLDSEVCDSEILQAGLDPSARLIEICRSVGATSYLTGGRALGYLDSAAFQRAKIGISVADYSKMPEYSQKYSPYEPNLSVLDFIAATGLDRATAFFSSISLAS